MKLIHGQEPVKKEDGNATDVKSKIPMADGILGVGRSAKAMAIGFSLVAALGLAKTGCTFSPAGLQDIDASQQDADVDHDAGPDADVDSGPDADVQDSGPDADVDSGPDADVDSGPDADVDAGPDADVDGGPVACAVADVGTFNGYIVSGTPQEVGGYVFEYLGKSGSDALFRITCGGSVVNDPLTCPVGIETAREIPVDGRRIRITPASANTTVTNSSITVELL